MGRCRVPWSDIPQELLTLIFERLQARADTFSFRLVCKKWRVSTSFAVEHRPNFLSPIFPFKFSVRECYVETKIIGSLVIEVNSVFLVSTLLGSKLNPWLCTMYELLPGKLSLRQPQWHSWYYLFGNSPPVFPDDLNLSCFKVTEVQQFYTIRSEEKDKKWKAILIADPKCANPKVDDHNIVVMISDGTLQLISIKDGTIDKITGQNRKYDDVVNFKGSIFAIDRKGRGHTLAYDSTRLHIIVAKPVGDGSGTDRKKRLCESANGELYLIHGCPPKDERAFKIYKLNEATKSWVEAKGIGYDRILIATYDSCFFVQAKDFPGWRGNCILFRKEHFPAYNSPAHPFSNALEFFGSNHSRPRGCNISVFHFDGGRCKTSYSELSWPPPVWLTFDTHLYSSASIGEIEIIRDFFNNVASESMKAGDMSDAMLAMKVKHYAKQDDHDYTVSSSSTSIHFRVSQPRLVKMWLRRRRYKVSMRALTWPEFLRKHRTSMEM